MDAQAALAGLRVLDLSALLPGPFATRWLADHGAQVIKVEPPGTGDFTRVLGPYAGGQATTFLALNRGKRCIAVDLKHPEGLAAVRRLAERADVVVESFRPGVAARLGLDFEVLRASRPGLVWCAISGYGQDGPYRDRPGHDLCYQAYAGSLAANRDEPGARPVVPGVQAADYAGALYAVAGILAALWARQRTGRGQFVDVALSDAAFAMMALPVAAHGALAGEEFARPLNGGFPGYRVYACADGRPLAVAALEPRFARRLCTLLGREDLLASLLPADAAAREAAIARFEALFRTRTRDEWLALLEDAGCCVAPVKELGEALADPQCLARGLLVDVGASRQVGVVPRLSETPGLPGAPAGTLGRDTDAVLGELGYDAAEIASLREAGAVA
ncbi:MAG: CoA transferase [Planctomycetes bacterium]|nr:CoA transferase [Planctomycetota bacterium]